MSNEIDLILTKLKIVSEEQEEGMYLCDKKHSKILLNYITNLQKRKITKEDVNKYFEENMCVSFDKFIENCDEQEKLTNYYKKKNERLKEKHFLIQGGRFNSKTYITNLEKEKEDYKSRIDKAIEYIWSTKYEYGDLEEDNEDFDIDVYELLNILNGGDE